MRDTFDTQRYQSQLQTAAIGRTFEHHETVDTTMRLARERADAGAPHGTLIFAEEQTAGVGRRGRSFQSPRGENLYFTLILRLPAERHRQLPLAVPAAVCGAIQAAGANVLIKWPNDVWAGSLKVCGMLIDAESGPGGLVAYPGIGINVNGDPGSSPELAGIATSIRKLTGGQVDREALLAGVCNRLESYLDGPSAVLSTDYRVMSLVTGRRVRLTFADGRAFDATADDILDDGTLRVRLPDGTTEDVTAAEVSLRPA
ncbi:MAG: biotin--[acetyl-CoA-carboxylase] ligase [Dehalococcoidia bacterium]